MSLPQGIDFRQTQAYGTGTDPTNCDYYILTGVQYGSHTTAQGNNAGWMDAGNACRDRGTLLDQRIMGMNFVGGPTAVYRFGIDVPSGSYKVRCAVYDAASTNQGQLDLYDSTTFLVNLVSDQVVGLTVCVDATNTSYTPAAWPGSNSLSASQSITSGTAIFRINAANNANYVLAHVWIEAVGGGAAVFMPAVGGSALPNMDVTL